jgi:hypothetical protein
MLLRLELPPEPFGDGIPGELLYLPPGHSLQSVGELKTSVFHVPPDAVAKYIDPLLEIHVLPIRVWRYFPAGHAMHAMSGGLGDTEEYFPRAHKVQS